MKPIVFLDFDGVINSENFVRTRTKRETQIDTRSVEWLNILVEKVPDIGFVISSTWRLSREIDELQTILNNHGFKGEVIGKTKDLRRGENSDSILRGNEILAWIKDNYAIIRQQYYEYNRYVIFDDDSDMLYWQRNNFIHIDPYFGISPHHIRQARKILGEDFKFI